MVWDPSGVFHLFGHTAAAVIQLKKSQTAETTAKAAAVYFRAATA